MNGLRSALAFLTVVPAGARTPAAEPGLGRGFFPAAGLLVGAGAALAGWLGGLLAGPLFGAVAAVAALALLSGGLHLDGLADSADGVLGGATAERRLEIMRDPRLGAFGVIALVLVLTADAATLAGIEPARAPAALIGAAALSRLVMLGVVLSLPYVRPAGLGVAAGRGRGLRDLALASLLAGAPALLDWRHWALALGAALSAGLVVAAVARARLGGATGDVYGAVVELGQLAGLVAYAVRL